MGESLGFGQVLQPSVQKSEAQLQCEREFNMKDIGLNSEDTDRIMQMAWEDRITFDSIKAQFDFSPGDIIRLVRLELKPSSFRLWRLRTQGRKSKLLKRRGFKVGRFRCPA